MATLDAAANALAAAFPDPWLRQYSLKANDVPAVVARLAARGLGANVVSRGEWALARRAGVPNARTTLEGIGKTTSDLATAVRAAAGGDPPLWVAIESLDELEALGGLARRAGLGRNGRPGLEILLRLNPDVAPETRAGLATGRGSSKFGMTETELTTAASIAVDPALAGALRPRGIHLHVGSALGAVDAWRDAVRRALALIALVRPGLDGFDTLDVGGGFPVGRPGAVPEPGRFARELPALLDGIPVDRRPVRWAVEPGRFLAARAGTIVASVLHVRDRPGGEPVVVLDAGMTELIRPALYGAAHAIRALTSLGRPWEEAPPTGGANADPGRTGDLGAIAELVRAWPGGASTGEPPGTPLPGPGGPSPAFPAAPDEGDGRSVRRFRVEGPICESTDSLGHHALPPLRRGDLVAIADAGAYAASMAMSYNGRPRAPQVLIEPDGRLVLARRRGTLTSLG